MNEPAGEEKRREEKLTYIYTYIRSLTKQTTNQDFRKVHRLISVPEDLHEAAKFLAPIFHTTISNLYVEGLLKHLENLADQLPANIQLSIIRPITTLDQKQPDSMLELEVDLIQEQLRPYVDKLKKIKPTPEWQDPGKTRFNREQIEKLLPKAIRLERRSRDPKLERLILDARDLLRM